jgi:hypothetical protein
MKGGSRGAGMLPNDTGSPSSGVAGAHPGLLPVRRARGR